MKKLISLLLVAVIVLGLCACGGEKEPTLQEGQVMAGFGRVDLSPSASSGVSLVGYGGNGTPPTPMQGALDRIYGTCIALTDAEGNTALIYTLDTLYTTEAEVDLVRAAVTEKTGIPGEHVVISSIHTHSSVTYSSVVDYAGKMAQAAVDALADQAPATIQAGSTNIENMNFVRHYKTKNGIVVGDNFEAAANAANPRTEHITQADGEMPLIRFVREDEEKKDIILANWQAHPKVASTGETEFGKANRPMLSADFVGWCRIHVEKNTDCLFAYYTGAAGNINPISRMSDLRPLVSQGVDEYGAELGTRLIAALDSLTTVKGGKVAVQQQKFGVTAVVTGAATEMELTAIRVGEIGFAVVPFEMFDTNGMEIKDQSDCTTTFVLTCASMPKHEYIPAEYVWDYNTGTQKAYELKSCTHERGTAEKVASELASMLNGLAG